MARALTHFREGSLDVTPGEADFSPGVTPRMPVPSIAQIRDTPPVDAEHLQLWIYHFTGIHVAAHGACRNHHAPLQWLADQWLNRPGLILILGARGSGKSFLQAILTHLESRFNPRPGTRSLG